METMELNLNEMEQVSGGWDWKRSCVGAALGVVGGAWIGGSIGGVPGAMIGGVIGAGAGVLMGME